MSNKISSSELLTLCNALLVAGNSLAGSRLTVDRLRSAVEQGHPALGGVKFDTPKLSALTEAIQKATEAWAGKLVQDGSETKLLSETVRTATRKDGSVFVQRQTRFDCGDALPAVAWLHNLRGYCNTVRRSGKTSAKTRQALVAEFNSLAKADFACLNVSDDKAGFGLVRAKEIVSDFKTAERDWLATFQANQTKAQAGLDLAQAKANAKAKTQGKGNGKTRKAYSVDGKGKAKGKDGSVFVRHEAKPIPSVLTVAPMTPATVS